MSKNICYVALPNALPSDFDNVYDFVRKQINKYDKELEVEPYKKFFSEKETVEIAKRHGFDDLPKFKEYLEKRNNDDGMENGLYYWLTTHNQQGKWDYFVLEGTVNCSKILNGEIIQSEMTNHELEFDYERPVSVVTLEGIWYSKCEHNISTDEMWENHLANNFYNLYADNDIAILMVHD